MYKNFRGCKNKLQASNMQKILKDVTHVFGIFSHYAFVFTYFKDKY